MSHMQSVYKTEHVSENTVKITCTPCVQCGKSAEVTVPLRGFLDWQAGAYVQDAFPGLAPPEREILISGTHPACFNVLFPPDEDEVYTCADLPCCDVGIGIIHHPLCGTRVADAV